MPRLAASGSVLAGWYTKYQFGGRRVAWPNITDISLNAPICPGLIRLAGRAVERGTARRRRPSRLTPFPSV
ncbi:MAG: hypothetical protein QOG05_3957 [Streptosporangiaceae bacterium]|jgi:hypothetical protein|nr:hypothetical protein [Streptosporangiaceae bacterium]